MDLKKTNAPVNTITYNKSKLEEFATYNDSLEEVFENKEQIEVSKFYEKLPKSHALAVQEWEEGKIYYREAK